MALESTMLDPPALNSSKPPGALLLKAGARRKLDVAPSVPPEATSSQTTGALMSMVATKEPPVPGAKENELAATFRPISVGCLTLPQPLCVHGLNRSRVNAKEGLVALASET